ncbi:rhodanese-like domain-containing protein [Gordonia asplenii]|nr:rhodanese-like domain-containing protein [Gordonia asplenii]
MRVVGQGRGVVVDARPQVRRHQGSLPGAVVVEPGEVSRVFGGTSTGWVHHDSEIAVVSVRSEAPRIAAEIADMGYRNVHYVDGGYTAMNRVAQRDSR